MSFASRFRSIKAFILAIIIHLAAILLLIFSVDFDTTVTPQPANVEPNIVDAVIIDQSKVDAEIKRMEKAEQDRQKEREKQEQKTRETEKKRQQEEKRLQDLKKQQKELEKKQQQEQQRLKEVEAQRKEQEKKKQQLEKEKQLLQEQKKAEEQAREKARVEEEKRKKEAQRIKDEEAKKQATLEKQQREEETRQKAEAEKKRKAAEEKQRAEAARKKALADELAAEEAELEQARNAKVVSQYINQIGSQVERYFNITGFPQGLQCVLEIRTVPGGEVVGVRVVKPSGDDRFDRQAEIAVKKASPLPVPEDKKIYDSTFRTFNFKFNPQG